MARSSATNPPDPERSPEDARGGGRPGGAPNADPPGPAWRRWLVSPWLAVFLGVACTANSAVNGFTYDDNPIVRLNARIRSLSNLREIWLTDWWQPQTEDERVIHRMRDRLYRPLAMYTFAINYAAGGEQPAGYHLFNILLHGAACGLVWLLARRLFGEAGLAAIAAALFAVHPVHCEAVANVVGRAEVLAAVFLMLGLIALLPRSGQASIPRTVAAAAAFLAAMMSKETAVCYPLLAGLAWWWRSAEGRAGGGAKDRLRADMTGAARARQAPVAALVKTVILLVPLAAYLPLRFVALEGRLLRDRPPSALYNTIVEADGAGRLLTPIAVLGEYARLFIMPNQLSSDYGAGVIDIVKQPDFRTFAGAAVVLGLVYGVAGLFGRSEFRRRCGLLAAMFIASYGLVSNTLLLIGVSMAERLMYWPSVPVLMLIAALAWEAWRRYAVPGAKLAHYARAGQLAGAAFLAVLGLRTVVRNQDWQSNGALFQADIRAWPRSAILNLNGADVLLAMNRPDAARAAAQYLHRALEIFPRNPKGQLNLAQAYFAMGEPDKARQYLESTLTFDPSNPDARRLLTQLDQDVVGVRARTEQLRAAATTRPADITLLTELVEHLRQLGKSEEARAEMEKAAAAAPDDPQILYLYAESLLLVNEPGKARPVLERVVTLDPNHWQAHGNLVMLSAGDDPNGALDHARIAHRLMPDDYRVNVNLAEALANAGQLDEALRLWRRIVAGLPADNKQRPLLLDHIKDLEQRRQ